MEFKIVYILGTIVVMLHLSVARPYLVDTQEADSEQLLKPYDTQEKSWDDMDEITAADKRPNYMNTNDLSAFQDPDLYPEEIAEEGKFRQKRPVLMSRTAPDGGVKRKAASLCLSHSGTSIIIVKCSPRG